MKVLFYCLLLISGFIILMNYAIFYNNFRKNDTVSWIPLFGGFLFSICIYFFLILVKRSDLSFPKEYGLAILRDYLDKGNISNDYSRNFIIIFKHIHYIF